MSLMNIYEVGKSISYDLKLEKLEKKLSFVFFPYKANDVIFTALLTFLAGLISYVLLQPISVFLSTSFLFMGLVGAVILYVYPFSIYYNAKVMEYSEEMLRAILHLSTYVHSGSSMEYAFLETEKDIQGILQVQFHKINIGLKRKSKTTLGSAITDYVHIWNEVNPQFVKGLRLLQIAALSDEKDKTRLIQETIETLMIDYMTIGKRSAENLSKNTKMLIGGGVLLPILSLLVLPILTVFMPELIRPELLAFIYVVLFPTVVLVAALSFSSNRIQVDTIRLEDHKDYKPLPKIWLIISIGVAAIFVIPSIPGVLGALQDSPGTIDSFTHFFLAWLLAGGIAIGIKIYSWVYARKYKKIWENIDEVEKDLPFVLQSFSTYYTLNTPFEKTIQGVIDDYNELGFKDHPVITAFKDLKKRILSSKRSVREIIKYDLKKIFPSNKTRAVISQISSFEEVSQDSAAKASRTIREQVINTYKLDDYIKTLLSDTVSLIKMTASMLAPLLCATAVVMTYAILKSTEFITEQLEEVTRALGTGDGITIELINMSEVISPIFIAAIVGVYLLEITIILSLFQTQIEIGNDKYKVMQSISDNMFSFALYSVMLFAGYIVVNIYLFQIILGGAG